MGKVSILTLILLLASTTHAERGVEWRPPPKKTPRPQEEKTTGPNSCISQIALTPPGVAALARSYASHQIPKLVSTVNAEIPKAFSAPIQVPRELLGPEATSAAPARIEFSNLSILGADIDNAIITCDADFKCTVKLKIPRLSMKTGLKIQLCENEIQAKDTQTPCTGKQVVKISPLKMELDATHPTPVEPLEISFDAIVEPHPEANRILKIIPGSGKIKAVPELILRSKIDLDLTPTQIADRAQACSNAVLPVSDQKNIEKKLTSLLPAVGVTDEKQFFAPYIDPNDDSWLYFSGMRYVSELVNEKQGGLVPESIKEMAQLLGDQWNSILTKKFAPLLAEALNSKFEKKEIKSKDSIIAVPVRTPLQILIAAEQEGLSKEEIAQQEKNMNLPVFDHKVAPIGFNKKNGVILVDFSSCPEMVKARNTDQPLALRTDTRQNPDFKINPDSQVSLFVELSGLNRYLTAAFQDPAQNKIFLSRETGKLTQDKWNLIYGIMRLHFQKENAKGKNPIEFKWVTQDGDNKPKLILHINTEERDFRTWLGQFVPFFDKELNIDFDVAIENGEIHLKPFYFSRQIDPDFLSLLGNIVEEAAGGFVIGRVINGLYRDKINEISANPEVGKKIGFYFKGLEPSPSANGVNLSGDIQDPFGSLTEEKK